MYKIGDKVETPLGWGILSYFDNEFAWVSIKGTPEIEFDIRRIKPYQSAHDKLIEMGYTHLQLSEDLTDDYYGKDINDFIWFSRENKSYNLGSFVEINLELSNILTDYLEEMGEQHD